MGIAGHMLGDKALRRLNLRTGMHFDRAFIRGHECEGRYVLRSTIGGDVCVHCQVDLDTYLIKALTFSHHWSSCYRNGRLPPPTDFYGGPDDG